MSPHSFQAPCGCVASFDGGQNELCPIHELEGLTSREALGVFLRRVLCDETDAQALAAVRAHAQEHQ